MESVKTKTPPVYDSALSINKVTELSGNAREASQALADALRAKQIDPEPTLRSLPAGEAGDKEAVARLISLARGHGYVVQLGSSGGALAYSINLPSAIHMLQSGHDNPVGIGNEANRMVAA